MRIATILFALLTMLAGGASADPVQEPAGEGAKRAYRETYQTVFDATLSAARNKRLALVDVDRGVGVIRLSHGGTLSNWGERVTVFVRPLGGDHTQVEIVNKPLFEFLMFSPHWDQVLLAQIDAELRARDPD
jgi:hypothetical protein